jgi:D-glycero-D-manno-heptose 1,7-bisphosphate phosphatase
LSDPAVFLDRDGVVVELVWDAVDGSFEGPTVQGDVRLVPGAADAIRRIRSLDYRTVVVSNQPGAAKGKASHEDLRKAHEHVVRLLADLGVVIDDYRYCLHHPDAVDPSLARACDCRKPKPGMLLAAAADLDLDLSRSWMIGDSDVDAEAGRAAGCRTILVENPRSTHRRRDGAFVDFRVRDIAHAGDLVVGETR